jgi:hypothetical protein
MLVALSGESPSLWDSLAGALPLALCLTPPVLMSLAALFTARGVGALPGRDIALIEATRWSWRGALRSSAIGFTVGLTLAPALAAILALAWAVIAVPLIALLGLEWDTSWIEVLRGVGMIATVVLGCGLALGLVTGTFFGLLGGFQSRVLATPDRPNDGIRRSLFAAIRFAVVFGTVSLVVFLAAAVILGNLGPVTLHEDLNLLVTLAGIASAWGAAVGALVYGGVAVVHHYTLRAILAAAGQLPLRLTPFLVAGSGRLLLRRVGGGFIFPHRYLQEFFATLTDDEARSIAPSVQ